MLIYYVVVIVLQITALSNLLQPEIQGLIMALFQNYKFWILIVTVPIICLVPDLFIKLVTKVYFPDPVDIVLKEQNFDPEYDYENEEIRMEHK